MNQIISVAKLLIISEINKFFRKFILKFSATFSKDFPQVYPKFFRNFFCLEGQYGEMQYYQIRLC